MKKILLVLALSIFSTPTMAESTTSYDDFIKAEREAQRIKALDAKNVGTSYYSSPDINCKKTHNSSAHEILTLGTILLSAYDQEYNESIFTVNITEDIFFSESADPKIKGGCIRKGIYQCTVTHGGIFECDGFLLGEINSW